MRLDRHRLTAWIALCAMLLISIAPLVSQSAALAQRTEPLAPTAHHQPCAHPHPPPQQAQHHDCHSSSSPPPAAAHDHAKCGYCHLLKLPSLLPSPTVLSTRGTLERQSFSARPVPGHPRSARTLHAPPRAPPSNTRAP